MRVSLVVVVEFQQEEIKKKKNVSQHPYFIKVKKNIKI
jgi:hypothetical protein